MPRVGSEPVTMRRARLVLGHAAAQRVAETVGVDMLHIKGYALDPALSWPGRESKDVDVLVRPGHVERFAEALEESGWRAQRGFAHSSAFEHAATFTHRQWGPLDVHRIFPGITAAPNSAFQRLWRDRNEIMLAGWQCPVPAFAGQALLLVLDSARSGRLDGREMANAWGQVGTERQREIRELVADLRAEVAFSAAVGGFEAYQGRRDYELWRALSRGGSEAAAWRASLTAAPTWQDRAKLVLRAPLLLQDGLTERRRGRRAGRPGGGSAGNGEE